MTRRRTRRLLFGLSALFLIARPARAAAQDPPSQPPPAIEDTIDASESTATPRRRLISWNEYDGPFFSIRLGAGFLYDYAAYEQDANSKEQLELSPDGKVRDFRVLLNGRLKFERKTTWSAGIMYDGANDEWLFRQSGIMVEVPEILGDIFVGRSKEGFSLNKVMSGYANWGMERSPISDATVPILADGIKWLGFAPKARLVWNLGVYDDLLSEGQSFSTYDNQIAARLAWLPLLSTGGGTLLHLGVSGRYGTPKDHMLRLRARPGAYQAPYFVDTGQFAADSSTMTGLEVYYRPGAWTFGSELFFQKVDAPGSGNPFFHGGEVFATKMLTGEVRSYNTRGGYFNLISPNRPVFHGGPGAWEVVAHTTWIDLDGGTLTGGKYWRFTPMLNWYLSDNVRLELAYGYGSLNRFDLIGKTQFFQTRIQLLL